MKKSEEIRLSTAEIEAVFDAGRDYQRRRDVGDHEWGKFPPVSSGATGRRWLGVGRPLRLVRAVVAHMATRF